MGTGRTRQIGYCLNCGDSLAIPRPIGTVRCLSCYKKERARIHKAWRAKNPERVRAYQRRDYQRRKEAWYWRNIRKRYGLSQADYQKLILKQNNQCAICGTSPNGKHLQVDHDHLTGNVRGLLCYHCNTGIGVFQENSELLNRAISYLALVKRA